MNWRPSGMLPNHPIYQSRKIIKDDNNIQRSIRKRQDRLLSNKGGKIINKRSIKNI